MLGLMNQGGGHVHRIPPTLLDLPQIGGGRWALTRRTVVCRESVCVYVRVLGGRAGALKEYQVHKSTFLCIMIFISYFISCILLPLTWIVIQLW